MPSPAHGKARILIIDDNPQLRWAARRMLEQAGYDVEEAADGEAGIRSYREARADLVITDILMPVMEGLETILGLRRLDPHATIIAVSGGDEQRGGYLRTAQMFGAARVLRKPFSRAELLGAVSDALVSSRTNEERRT